MPPTEQTMWALGWLSSDGSEYPTVAVAGAWRIYPTRVGAVAARLDPRQDLRRVRVTVEVLGKEEG